MDARLYRSINHLADRTAWAHGFFRLYAKDGIAIFAVLLVVGWFVGRREDDLRAVANVVTAGASALLALGLGQVLGNLVDRARPYTAMPGAHLLVSRTADFSFPSDHATAAGAVAIGLLFARRSIGVCALALAVVMAFARVYVGAHYPGDVVAGLLLGGVVAAIVRPLGDRLVVPVLRWVGRSRLRLLVLAGS